MPLSEEEMRLLQQMERALAAEDPSFASALRGPDANRAARLRFGAAIAVFALGIGALLGGAVLSQTWLGILGFLVMVGSTTVALSVLRQRAVSRTDDGAASWAVDEADEHRSGPRRLDDEI